MDKTPLNPRLRFEQTKALFWLLYGFMAFAYGAALYGDASLRQPAIALPAAALILMQMLLHDRLAKTGNQRVYLGILVAQNVLLLVTSEILRGQAVVTLFFPLIGEALAADNLWVTIIGFVLSGFGWCISLYRLGGGRVIALSLPAVAFVATYVYFFKKHQLERNRAQQLLDELQAAHRQLKEYAEHVEMLSISRERQRMARELHDTLAQGLAAVIMQLETMDALLEAGKPERAQEVVHRALGRARTTLSEARSSIQALREASMDDGQLFISIRDEVDRFTQTTSVPCLLELPPNQPRVPSAAAHHALRIVQEGLANIGKHAHAKQASIRVSSTPELLSIELQDDGCGFEFQHSEKQGHYGLRGIRERVRLLGGQCNINSSTGRGTTIQISLPLDEE